MKAINNIFIIVLNFFNTLIEGENDQSNHVKHAIMLRRHFVLGILHSSSFSRYEISSGNMAFHPDMFGSESMAASLAQANPYVVKI